MGKLNVKAGDKVVVITNCEKYVSVVEKITPSGLIKVGGSLYYDTGSMRGGGTWNRVYIRETSEEEIEQIKRYGEISKVHLQMKEFKKRLTHEDAMKIKNILDRYSKEVE